MTRVYADQAMKFTRDRGRLTTVDAVFAVLLEANEPLTTEGVADRLGRLSASRHVVYRRLAKLEQEGRVEKEILFGATSIGHAFWSPTTTSKEGER